MTRAGALLVAFLALAACAVPDSRDTPYAPGVARGDETVDPMLVGHRLMDAGEYELAIDAFSRAALSHGMSAQVLSGIGTAHLKLGRVDTAERILRRALDHDEHAPEIWNNLGVALMEKRDIAEAAEVFRRAYALDNGQSDSIRDNLRLALEKFENPEYGENSKEEYKLVRRGSSDYLIRALP